MSGPGRGRVTGIRGAWIVVLLAVASQLAACGYKGPLVAADAAGPVGKAVETSKVPDAGSAAPPAAQDAERVIDEGDASAP